MAIIMYNTERLLSTMKQTALKCGEVILNAHSEMLQIEVKSSLKDLVTDYDVKVQQLATQKLKEAFPECTFFCEENGLQGNLYAPLVFIIDPIDGTSNFIHQLHHSCVSIGCMSHGELIAGVVFDPYKNELFSASKGQGAFLNQKQIHVAEANLQSSLVMFGTSPYNQEQQKDTISKMEKIYPLCLDLRRSGSAALDICYTACGRAGLYFEGVVSLWDYAAAMMILKEAGGISCNYDGRPIPFDGRKSSVLTGSEESVQKALSIFKN